MIIEKYGISLRLVEQEDAAFIVKLRTDEVLSRYLSPTSSDIEVQKKWMLEYKEREKLGQEFYFVAQYKDVVYGTIRVYNIEPNCFEIGSWLFSADTPLGIAILADIVGREFAFEKLKVDKCKFEVRRNNLPVVKYHKRYKPTLIDQTEQDYYYVLSRADFEIHKNKLVKLLSE